MNITKRAKLENAYLVGGAVRDQLLGIDSQDNDYVVVGSSVDNMLKLGFQSIGKDFPVFLHPQNKQEYALARTERKTGKGYTGFNVDASQEVTLEQDLARRDLTINAMALDEYGQIIDPFAGQQDLKNKVLRHTTKAFTEDPVRVLRIARFLARYGSEWTIHPDTKRLINDMQASGELLHLVPERVWKETEKALSEKYPQLYFEALSDLGVLATLFPELALMQGVMQPPEHHPEGDVFKHTMLVLKRAADLCFDLPTRFAALTHDFGKAVSFHQSGNLVGHEAVGVPVVVEFCERLRIPNAFRDIAKLSCEHHLRCHSLFELRPKTVQKLIVEQLNAVQQPERFTQFLQACQCDAQGRGPSLVNKPYPQRQLAEYLRAGLAQLNTKSIVKAAMGEGKKGLEIGEAVRIAQIDCIRRLLTGYTTSLA